MLLPEIYARIIYYICRGFIIDKKWIKIYTLTNGCFYNRELDLFYTDLCRLVCWKFYKLFQESLAGFDVCEIKISRDDGYSVNVKIKYEKRHWHRVDLHGIQMKWDAILTARVAEQKKVSALKERQVAQINQYYSEMVVRHVRDSFYVSDSEINYNNYQLAIKICRQIAEHYKEPWRCLSTDEIYSKIQSYIFQNRLDVLIRKNKPWIRGDNFIEFIRQL